MSRHIADSRGFTLLELMLALSLLSIVIIGVLESLSQQRKTSIVTENLVEVQNNVRAISSLLEREIRMAGFMIPNAVAVCGIDDTTGPDQLFLSENEAIVPDDERAGDLGARWSGTVWSNPSLPVSGPVTYSLDSTTTDLDGDGSYFYDNDGNGSAEADFRTNAGFIVGDVANPHRGVICGTVNSVTATQIEGTPLAGALATLIATDAEPDIVFVPAARYWVDTSFTTGKLKRNGDVLANGVDDIQFSYFFDMDDDGVIDSAASETPGMESSTGSIVYVPGDTPTSPWNNDFLREVRFSIVVRTRATDSEFDAGSFQAFENRAPVAGNDGFRRRLVVGAVRPRNVGRAGSI